MKELDLSKELKDFYEKNKQEKIVRNWEETLKKSKGWFHLDLFKFNVIGDGIEFESERPFKSVHTDNEFCFSLNQHSFLFYNTFFLFFGTSSKNPDTPINQTTYGKIYFKVNYSNINDIEIKHESILGRNTPYYNCKKQDFYSEKVIGKDYEKLFIQIDLIYRKIVEKEIEEKERLLNKEEEKERLLKEGRLLKEEKEKERLLKEKYSILLKELDSDGNGIIDIVEGDDYGKILKLNQDKIIEINRDYIRQFVQISNYLKTKRKSLQSIYEQLVLCVNNGVFRRSLDYGLEKYLPNNKLLGIKEVNERTGWGIEESKKYVDNIVDKYWSFNGNSYVQSLENEPINEYIEILKDDSHIFNLLLVHSITMVQSLINNDMITFYEIYEKLDQLNMFDSKHEKDLKGLLVNVNDGLENIINEIKKVGENIVSSIDDLSFITEDSTQLIKDGLESVNSSIQTNNLLTGIQTYQMYKINKNTKSLRG